MPKYTLLAPISGTIVDLASVPDEAFSTGMLGIGFAVEPSRESDGSIYAPADGTIETVADARHAYTIHTDDGLDILVHIGIDTVSLASRPFAALVSPGDRVKAGQPIARADLPVIRAADLPVVTPVIISNPDALRGLTPASGTVEGGKSVAATYQI
ncbi:MAG: PTS glucose transporter subunit IIA [Clostridia bacterium]|nr:PTS glucose transporter subunit IIA [Clostridia bacterium]